MITTGDPSASIVAPVNAASAVNVKSVLELGQLLWCGPPTYLALCSDWDTRWSTWKSVNASVLNSGQVLGFIVRDEPFSGGADIIGWERAAAKVKADYPWAKILLIEGASIVADNDPGSYFNQLKGQIPSMDWVGLDRYSIHPATDDVFNLAMQHLKAAFPGKGVIYVADGWWNDQHSTDFGTTDMSYLGTIMDEWYDVARADPDAVLMAVFIWDPFAEGTSSVNMPRPVLLEQVKAGRVVTGRSPAPSSPVVGMFQGVVNDSAQGWACDPDGAWSDSVQVDVYADGVLLGSGWANQPGYPIDLCQHGSFHAFNFFITSGPYGRSLVAVLHDLTSGTVQVVGPAMSRVSWIRPSSVSFGPANTLTVAGSVTNGSGSVQMVWRDASAAGPWNVVAYQPTPATDGTWSNTITASNYCHDYDVYTVYSGVTSAVTTYHGLTSGYCTEQVKVTWVQPQSTAGFGPAGSMVVKGTASGAPSGTRVQLFWEDLSATKPTWMADPNPQSPVSGIWYGYIQNANPAHRYAVYGRYDVKSSATCTYAGSGSITTCP
ncbi:MAG: hypothetical protein JO040_10670 [Gemmatimonadetes bacterium]|nr:hypothetical protein [Gemmatimonadota bacterium]